MPQCQFMFSTIFLFQIFTTRNILAIGRNKSQSSYFSNTNRVQRGDEDEPGGGHTMPWCGPTPGRAWLWCGPLGCPLTSPFRLYIAPDAKTLRGKASIHEKFRSRRRHRRQVLGDRSLCSGTLPGQGIAPGAIFIDSTAIFIVVVDSHDEEGVVLPRG
jgi:hypothetical protein